MGKLVNKLNNVVRELGAAILSCNQQQKTGNNPSLAYDYNADDKMMVLQHNISNDRYQV